MPREETAGHDDPDGRRLGLRELTRAAGVSVRTVRYYIAEGLLPPPAGGGPRSHYTAAHLDRLRLIARLKAAYLPLKEIRRRLAGLDDAEVRRALAAGPAADRPDAALDDSAAYLDHVLGVPSARPAFPATGPTAPRIAEQSPAGAARPGAPRPAVWGLRGGPPVADAGPGSGASMVASGPEAPPDPVPGYPAPNLMLGRAYPAALPFDDAPAEGAAPSAPETWRRVPLGDDAELLIRETAYERRRDRVDWLLAWARKVFA